MVLGDFLTGYKATIFTPATNPVKCHFDIGCGSISRRGNRAKPSDISRNHHLPTKMFSFKKRHIRMFITSTRTSFVEQ